MPFHVRPETISLKASAFDWRVEMSLRLDLVVHLAVVEKQERHLVVVPPPVDRALLWDWLPR